MEPLLEKYQNKIRTDLEKKLNIGNIMAVPKLVKIVVNCGIGEAVSDKKVLESMTTQLTMITGQKPYIAKSRKAISTFKLRIGDPIGIKVTLRGKRMYDFFTKFVTLALPRVRDFRGVPINSFDGKGNYTLGIKEQSIFPELEYRLIDKIRGFEISFVTSAKTNREAKELLEMLGMPFEKKEAKN